jgi:hypothetical protein
MGVGWPIRSEISRWRVLRPCIPRCLLVGTAHLGEQAHSSTQFVWTSLVLMAVINSLAIGWDGPRLGQASMGSINTVLGVICTYWLWNADVGRYKSEKLVGPLLVLLGLIQFIYVTYQEEGARPCWPRWVHCCA